jgi:predicted metal-dependent hydrolase
MSSGGGDPASPLRFVLETSFNLLVGSLTLHAAQVKTFLSLRARVNLKIAALWVGPRTTRAGREALLEGWYREQLREAAAPLVSKWQAKLGVEVDGVVARRMKTKWGSCTPARRSVRLNTDLAKNRLHASSTWSYTSWCTCSSQPTTAASSRL